MNRKFFGLSCLSLLFVCILGGFLALFAGSVLFSQVQAGLPTATAAPAASSPTLSPSPELAQPSTSAIPVTPSPAITVPPFMSATPGLAPLGTLTYPLTVTAEFAIESTRVKAFQDNLAVTRTANAQQAQMAHATLTAMAAVKAGK